MKLTDAIKAVKDNARGSFDESVEMHINFILDVKQADQQLRTTTTLPHGTGKDVKVAVFAEKEIKEADLNLTEEDVSKIQKGNLVPGKDFDVLIAQPKFMAQLAKLGPILGPAGMMPNPKTGTVTEDVTKAVTSFKQGKVELRTEQTAPIIHTLIGKISFENKQLEENFMEVVSTLRSNKPIKAKPNWIKDIFVCSSMGKSVLVDTTSL